MCPTTTYWTEFSTSSSKIKELRTDSKSRFFFPFVVPLVTTDTGNNEGIAKFCTDYL